MYASFKATIDLEEPTEFTSFTCTSEYNRGQGYAEGSVVKSFVGQSSLRVSDNGNSKWNEIAQQDEISGIQSSWSRTEGRDEEDYRSFEIEW